MIKYHNKPEYYLQSSGMMNEYVQEFILSHNFHFEAVNVNDPDNMTYEVVFCYNTATSRFGIKNWESFKRVEEKLVLRAKKNRSQKP